MRALDDIVEGLPVGAYLRIDTLTDDDRVIDHDTQHDDETEQADGINRHGPHRHEPDGAEEAHRQSHHDPECDLHAQEQRQHDEYEDRAHEHVVEHQRQTSLEIPRQVDPRVHLDAGRQLGLLLVEVFAHRGRRVELVLLAARHDLQRRRSAPVEASVAVGLDKAVLDRGDIAERQARAVRESPENEPRKFLPRVNLPLGTQENVAAFRLDRAARQID